MSEAAPLPAPAPVDASRRKFLAVVDHSPECHVALHFAARRAQHTGGLVTLLYVIVPGDFQQWAGVERVMREEAREEAEGFLQKAATHVNEITGAMPELVIREGRPADEIRALLKEDQAISILILRGRHVVRGARTAGVTDRQSGDRRLSYPRHGRARQPHRRAGRRADIA